MKRILPLIALLVLLVLLGGVQASAQSFGEVVIGTASNPDGFKLFVKQRGGAKGFSLEAWDGDEQLRLFHDGTDAHVVVTRLATGDWGAFVVSTTDLERLRVTADGALELVGLAADPDVSAADAARIYYNTVAGEIRASQNGGAYDVIGAGEANTASNLGAGEGVFAGKVLEDLTFKSLVEGAGISITSTASEITIASTVTAGHVIEAAGTPLTPRAALNFGLGLTAADDAGNDETDVSVDESALTLSNLGGTLSISKGGTGNTTSTTAFDALAPTTTKGDVIVHDGTDNVRLPVATDGWVLTLDSTQTEGVRWAAAPGASGGEANTASNLGTGEGVFAGKVLEDLQFKSLVEGANITLSTDANEITIASTPGASALDDLTDVTITTPAEDEVLTYNGSAWVNAAPTGGGGTGTGVRATKSGSQSISFNVQTDVTFDVEEYDDDGWHSIVSATEDFTVPAAGRYIVQCWLRWETTNDVNDLRGAAIYLNDTIIAYDHQAPPSAVVNTTNSVILIRELAANDVLNCRARHQVTDTTSEDVLEASMTIQGL